MFNCKAKVILFFLLSIELISPQVKTNLEMFYDLIDSSANLIISKTPKLNEQINVEINLLNDIKIFENRVIASLNKERKNFIFNSHSGKKFNYQIEKASVRYGEIFRDGIFGKQYLSRNFNLNGSIAYLGEINFVQNFSYSLTDTIEYNSVKDSENSSFPFTQAEIPAEPFFSNLIEPVILIASTGVAVYLFFTVRSK